MVQLCDDSATHPGYDAPVDTSPVSRRWSARQWALAGLEIPVNLTYSHGSVKYARTLGMLIEYGDDMHRMCSSQKVKRMTDEELTSLADQWLEALIVMSSSHDAQERTDMDATSDRLMQPLLTAPIAQVRQFAHDLAGKLEAEPRVPWLVWTTFKKIVEPLVLKGPDGETLHLQHLLAMEVAELVVPRLAPEEIVAAMAGALQWRAPETLQKVKAAVQSPAAPKPKLTGRQSCLFLEIRDDNGERLAEVVL